MIVFGQNSFRLKKYTQQELGFPVNPGEQTVEFIVKQHYAHLFWIPVFPLGKIYAIKRQNDPNLYEMPLEIKMLIKARKEVKTSPFSFSLFILAAVIGLGYIGMQKMEEVSYQNSFNLNRADQMMKVTYPTTGDFYRFGIFSEGNNSNYSSHNIVLKVASYTDKKITFASIKEEERLEKQYSYNLNQEFENEIDFNREFFEIEKAELEKLVFEGRGSFETNKYFVEEMGFYIQYMEMERKPLSK